MLINPQPTLANIGGKALQLDRLKSRFNVPDYFVLLFEQRAELNDPAVQRQILDECEKRGFDSMAVRSSASCEDLINTSFAGMFETILNTTHSNVISAIDAVLNSVSSLRVQEYCKTQKIDVKQIQMAVIIQKQVDSRISGVCFSRTPENTELLLIEACYGLGEALVSGLVSPDSYLIDRSTGVILSESVGYQKVMFACSSGNVPVDVPFHCRNAKKLADNEITKVADVSKKIEDYLQFGSADVEWSIEGDILFILQARPWSGFHL